MDPRDSDNVREREEGPAASMASTAEHSGPAQAQAQASVPAPAQVLSPVTADPPPAQAQVPPFAQPSAPPTPPKHSPTSTARPQILTPVPRPVRSVERLMTEDPYSPSRDHGYTRNGSTVQPLPGASASGEIRLPGRSRTVDTHLSGRPASRLDWIVPVEEKVIPKLSVGERLQPTLTRAHLERDKYAVKAKMTGYALNAAIGMQVLLGSLTTGLSAAATTGRQAAIATTVLGGLSTLVASYLARARGSNEPELSITRVKDLEQFIRECDAFHLDHGHVMTNEHDEQLFRFRSRFEELLGNASGERKLSPPV
ncbi:hypothetical protein H2248_008157 [Termitomyces sp. 'cryptogamus']|nr:hypothetical protein H2248_008157 [Termitomyces sp. 'cryptogamus']